MPTLARPPVKSVPALRLEEVASSDQLRVVREAAARQETDAARISGAIFEALRAEIADYASIRDAELIHDVQSVSAALVTIWLRAVKTGEISERDLAPIRLGARRRARQGISLTSLLKAYRIAIRVMWRELVLSPEWQQPEFAPLLSVLAEWVLDFADAVSTEVDTSYLDEQRKLAGEKEQRRSALLELVLAGRLEEARLEVLQEVRVPHAMVVVELSNEPAMEELDRLGDALFRRVGISLWTVREKAVVGAVRRPASEKRAQLLRMLEEAAASEPSVVAIGVGADSDGPDTTASSYAEASDAARLGRAIFGDTQRVHDFIALGHYSLALKDRALAARWSDGALAGCRPFLKRSWFEPTLESFLVRRGNQKSMARDLAVHLNTVKYRLGIMRTGLGARLDNAEVATELLMAIRLNRITHEPDLRIGRRSSRRSNNHQM